jgi:hypothetical protein
MSQESGRVRTLTLKLPLLAFIAGTRAALGFGAGLLLAGKIPERRRRQIGMTLVTIGAATTIPALRAVVAGVRRGRSEAQWLPESEYLREGAGVR